MSQKEKLVEYLVLYGKNIKRTEIIGHNLDESYYRYLGQICEQISTFNNKYENMNLYLSVTENYELKTHLVYGNEKIPIRKSALKEKIGSVVQKNEEIEICYDFFVPFSETILGNMPSYLNLQLINQGYIGY